MTEYTKSAGGVVLNKDNDVLVVNQHSRAWSLPKGHIEDGEDMLEAARREIHEESGISKLQFVRKLGSYQRHKIGLSGDDDVSEYKTITMFLFTTDQSELKPLDDDNPCARWVNKEEVTDLLTHQKDRDFFKTVKNRLNDTAVANMIAHPMKIFSIILLGGIIVQSFYPIGFLPDSWFVRVALGSVFFIYAILLGYSAKQVMGQAKTSVKPQEETTTIISEGPFRYTRNPLYLTLFLLHFTFAVILNSVWILAATFVLIVVIHFGVVLPEEKYLERKFGYRYLAYKQNVRRWL